MSSATGQPITDHLWQLGFNLSFRVERLPVPWSDGEHTFVSKCFLVASPERGEARRLFGRKGQMASEVVSNVPLEVFGQEKDEGRTQLKDRYTEKCAKTIFDALKAEVSTLPKPPANHVPV